MWNACKVNLASRPLPNRGIFGSIRRVIEIFTGTDWKTVAYKRNIRLIRCVRISGTDWKLTFCKEQKRNQLFSLFLLTDIEKEKMVATIRKTISNGSKGSYSLDWGANEVEKPPNEVTTITKPTVDEKKDDSTAITEASSVPGSGPPVTAVDISKWDGEDIDASLEAIRIKELQLMRKQNEKTFVEAQKGRQAAESNGNKLDKMAEMMEVANESKLNLKKEAEKSARKAKALGAINRRKDNEIKKLQINLAASMMQNEQGGKENRKNSNPSHSGKSAVVVKGADDHVKRNNPEHKKAAEKKKEANAHKGNVVRR